VRISAEICSYDEAVLPDDECRALRSTLYSCSRVTPSDGLPQLCIDRALTALECLEAGYLANASLIYPDGGAVVQGAQIVSASSRDALSGSVGGRHSPEPKSRSARLLAAAQKARAMACGTGSLTGDECVGISEGGDASSSSEGAAEQQARPEAKRVPYQPNMVGHISDGWAMALCAKCNGRPETMVRSCRRPVSLQQCQRQEGITGQNICNQWCAGAEPSRQRRPQDTHSCVCHHLWVPPSRCLPRCPSRCLSRWASLGASLSVPFPPPVLHPPSLIPSG
jgi:hypothetical protein